LTQSNLGRWPDGPSSGGEGKWTVDEVYFAQGDATQGSAIKLNVTGSQSGAIGVTVTWGDGAVDKDFVESFVRTFKDAVEVAVKRTETK